MLVPVIETHKSSGPANPLAAKISVPGAATSGFGRPSRVGPWLLDMLIRSRASSRFATQMIRCPQPSEPTDDSSTLDLSTFAEATATLGALSARTALTTVLQFATMRSLG
jgi:hypothetical protein